MNELHANTSLQNRRYAIQKTLGQGGFGITYLAYDNVNRRQVAIKEFFMKELCNRNGKTRHIRCHLQAAKNWLTSSGQSF